MAAVTVCGDFGAQENKICHCFHLFPICHFYFNQFRFREGLPLQTHLFSLTEMLLQGNHCRKFVCVRLFTIQ